MLDGYPSTPAVCAPEPDAASVGSLVPSLIAVGEPRCAGGPDTETRLAAAVIDLAETLDLDMAAHGGVISVSLQPLMISICALLNTFYEQYDLRGMDEQASGAQTRALRGLTSEELLVDAAWEAADQWYWHTLAGAPAIPVQVERALSALTALLDEHYSGLIAGRRS